MRDGQRHFTRRRLHELRKAARDAPMGEATSMLRQLEAQGDIYAGRLAREHEQDMAVAPRLARALQGPQKGHTSPLRASERYPQGAARHRRTTE